MKQVDIPYYRNFLPTELIEQLEQAAEPVPGIDGLVIAKGLQADFPDIETRESLEFTCELYLAVRESLGAVLDQRRVDREFIDQSTRQCVEQNQSTDFQSAEYKTVIGQADAEGRVVVGPLDEKCEPDKVTVPEFLKGFQVTLFGPPDSAKMAINAMNALNRKPADEAEIITQLVEESGAVPRWGADNEDSQTPTMASFLQACRNLIGCFDGTIAFTDPKSGKKYQLDESGLSLPIKRIPGLALPDGNHLYHGNPLPLHLYDFASHLFHNWNQPESLVFYIPKLENEFEAQYLRNMIELAEQQLKEIHPEYEIGTVRLFIVFENPRAIFRIREIAAALAPYFLGGSLGWHDFLASTARLFKHDPNYRIPVKADPNIVINHIRESHHLLVDSLSPMGAISIGGMYGTLYEDNNPDSYEVSMLGYIKDVISQLKRGLQGFWVAHPAFVRPGLALVEAFQRREKDPKDDSLNKLVEALVDNPENAKSLNEFIKNPDVEGLDNTGALYYREVLAASLNTSDVIANDDPKEVAYNVFQALQYLTDWLCGNGCVALPATIDDANGVPVFVRIMDDLATTERSRWELWAEVNHGRVSEQQFEQILEQEIEFIRADKQTGLKRPQVRWSGDAADWYPIAVKLLRQLVLDPEPVEFVTELLMPFTFDVVRKADDPWSAVNKLCPGKFS